MANNSEREIEDAVRKEVEDRLESDAAGVFSKKEVMNRVREKIREWPQNDRVQMLDRYSNSPIDRRSFLKMMGFTLGGAVVASSGGWFMGQKIFDAHGDTVTGRQTAQDISIDFSASKTKHAVDDLNMDAGGNTPINDALERAGDNGWLVEFPPGDYLVTKESVISSTQAGLKGLGEGHKDTKFVLGGSTPQNARILKFTGKNFLMQNMSIDQGPSPDVGASMWVQASDNVLMEDVEFLGKIPIDNFGQSYMLDVDMVSQSGVGVLRRVHMREGAVKPGYPDGTSGTRMGQSHKGLVIHDCCQFIDMGSSANRLSDWCNGVMQFHNCYFEDNDNTNIRIHGGAHPNKQSAITNTVHFMDGEASTKHGEDVNTPGTEGLHLGTIDKKAEERHSDRILIEDSDFYWTKGDRWGGRLVYIRRSQGQVTFRNCRLYNDSGNPTVYIQSPNISPSKVIFENCQFAGGKGPLKTDRNDAELRDCCVAQGFSIGDFETSGLSRSGCTTAKKEPPSCSGSIPAISGSSDSGEKPC